MAHMKRARNRGHNQEVTTDEKATSTAQEQRPVPQEKAPRKVAKKKAARKSTGRRK